VPQKIHLSALESAVERLKKCSGAPKTIANAAGLEKAALGIGTRKQPKPTPALFRGAKQQPNNRHFAAIRGVRTHVRKWLAHPYLS
jgi:hypothetical protein